MLLFGALFLLACMSSCPLADPSPYPEVDVFVQGEAGYFCHKIPYLFVTRKGTVLAFAEARWGGCWDWSPTDLVFKRSTDNGMTWSSIQIMVTNSSHAQNISNVVGNAAPLQLAGSGRILVPFCRNNFEVWQTYSDDDGMTWAPREAIPQLASALSWQWIATGPPGGIQLRSGRLLVPAYYSLVPDTNGEISRSVLFLNDDPLGSAQGWYVGAIAPGLFLTNECQAVELSTPNHILVAVRGILTQRIQIESLDGGKTLGEPYYVTDITEPLEGCEGSIIRHPANGTLFYSGTTNTSLLRYNMTVWVSQNEGKAWNLLAVINQGRTGYSSLQVMPNGNSVGLLYERSNLTGIFFQPTQISFLVVWPIPKL